MDNTQSLPPSQRGLYDPSFEHDACGVGFLAHLRGHASHDLVDRGLRALERMEHRGATGAEPNTGDGAGILIQIPHALFEHECAQGAVHDPESGKPLAALPAAGGYAVGPQAAALAKLIFAMVVRQEGQVLLGWRRVPTENRSLGQTARSVEPVMDHVFLAPGPDMADMAAFERMLYVIR